MLSSSLPVVRRVLGILLGAAALILAFAVLVPALLGYQRYVITFRPPGHAGLVTHRIASVRTTAGQRVFTTKGDANRVADAWGAIALHDARQARVAFHLPYLGYGLATLSDRRVRMIVIGVPALLIALAALSGLWRDSAPAPQSRSTRPA